jgi:pre-mRNA-processing factor 6
MQTVQLHREIGDLPRALTLVNEALARYRSFYKLWLIKAQVQDALNLKEEARATYEEAITVEGVKNQR